MKATAASVRPDVRGMSSPIRVVFCWTEASGYMAACWRALAERLELDVHVLHLDTLGGTANAFLREPALLDGVSNEVVESNTSDIDRRLLAAVAARNPDVIVLCGWLYRPYLRAIQARELASARLIIGMDSPWRGTLTQRLARYRLAPLIKRAAAVVTSGERGSEYARRLGVSDGRIYGGFYGFDFERFSAIADKRFRSGNRAPRQFLFVGRYVPQKDLKTLVAAYSAYRESVSNPWGFTCCGSGPDVRLLSGVPGVVDEGFAQPKDLATIFGRHSAFVLPSRFEPWGVVLAEAAAAGLPVICTSACGAGVDLVRPYFNGLTVAPSDPAALARAMRWIHDHESELPMMGRRGQALAEPYSADAWATRWHNYILEVLDAPRPTAA